MTATSNEAPFDMVAGDPAAYFESPKSIVDDATLSRVEKLHLLDEWELDITVRSAAADEGMVPNRAAPLDRDVQAAAAISSARSLVAESEETAVSSLPVRLWKRLIQSA